MNRDMTVDSWPDVARLVQERETAWKQARLRRANDETDETEVSRTDEYRTMRAFALAGVAGGDGPPWSEARRH